MEIKFTNKMLADVLKDTFTNFNIDKVEHVKISKQNQLISIEIVSGENVDSEDFSFETGDQIKISV